MPDYTPLDHPIWNALNGPHRAMAMLHGDAACYPEEVSPLAAVRDPTPAAFRDLAEIAPNRTLGLVARTPVTVPGTWKTILARMIDQMVWVGDPPPPTNEKLLRLTEADVLEMVALAKATEPGPFAERTITMGPYYFGIRAPDGRLAAMAGERLCIDGFREISAVCTYPEFRGKGYAATLMNAVAREIFAEGKIPFLHVKTENTAKALYERLGLRVRTPVHFTVIAPA